MIHVSVALAPRKVAPSLSPIELRLFTDGLTLRQCATVTEIVAGEMHRRGFRRVVVGNRIWRAVEALVCYDIVARGLDLDEIGAEIERAKWEAQWECAA